MVKPLILAALLGLSTASAATTRFPAQSVTISKSGQWHDDPYHMDTPQHCARFRPATAEMTRWFRRAKIVSRPEWGELVWTQCSADGTVTSAGRVYRWHLDQSGRGNISRTAQDDIYLSGPELPFRPGRD